MKGLTMLAEIVRSARHRFGGRLPPILLVSFFLLYQVNMHTEVDPFANSGMRY